MSNILIIATGGTIAGLRHEGQNRYTAAVLSIEQMLAQWQSPGSGSSELAIPFDDVTLQLSLMQLCHVDSKDASPDFWIKVTNATQKAVDDPAIVGVVITHGTDTMEETLIWLDAWLKTDKPVVLTGAMQPFDNPNSDGKSNFLQSIQAVEFLIRSQLSGVFAVFCQKMYRAIGFYKAHRNQFDAFSGNVIGHYDMKHKQWRMDSGVRFAPGLFKIIGLNSVETPSSNSDPIEFASWPYVPIIYTHPGLSLHQIWLDAIRGSYMIVLQGYGNGTVSEKVQLALESQFKLASKKQVPVAVVVTTRVPNGLVHGVCGTLCTDTESNQDHAPHWITTNLTSSQSQVLGLILGLIQCKGVEVARIFSDIDTYYFDASSNESTDCNV